ncbi:hypothetical protein AVEN_270555-1 [Araneus ventricosus]|uniref:Uncharacterized protein n=1 Tax=Araneus ventricosus TaxID=182803 RepID=A0A4Y2B7M8_ARAVE|nr:hypothetical protein AVEN_270555-1 [Araneus ventricosus]
MFVNEKSPDKQAGLASPGGTITVGDELPPSIDITYLLREGSSRDLRWLLGIRPHYSSYCSGWHSKVPGYLGRTEVTPLWLLILTSSSKGGTTSTWMKSRRASKQVLSSPAER